MSAQNRLCILIHSVFQDKQLNVCFLFTIPLQYHSAVHYPAYKIFLDEVVEGNKFLYYFLDTWLRITQRLLFGALRMIGENSQCRVSTVCRFKSLSTHHFQFL
jgi:hypothetical protein